MAPMQQVGKAKRILNAYMVQIRGLGGTLISNPLWFARQSRM
jgi:hypothetical protein